MTITIDGTGTITGASTLATTIGSPTLTTPNINSAPFATVSGTAPLYGCRVWVNFDGTTSTPCTIRGSGNVASVTKNGSGDYTVTFTTAMPDTNYAANISVSRSGDNTNIPVRQFVTYAVGSLRFLTGDGTGGTDMNYVNVTIFR